VGIDNTRGMRHGAPTHPEARRVWWITLVMQHGLGLTNGLFLYVWGPYFYDHFSINGGVGAAITITMILFAMRQTLVALLEVPVGALADTIGRGHVVILSMVARAFFFLTLAAMAFADHVTTAVFWASLASIGYALSYTLFNGAFSAWCADTVRERAPAYPYAWFASRYAMYQAVGEIVGSVFSIWLFIEGHPFAIFFAGAVISYALMGYGITVLREPRTAHASTRRRLDVALVLRDIGQNISDGFVLIRSMPVLTWVIMVYGSYMFLMSLVLHLFPVYLREVAGAGKLSTLWIGLVVLSMVVQFLGARTFAWLNDRLVHAQSGNRARFAMYRRFFVSTAVICAGSVLALSGSVALQQSFHLVIFGVTLCVVTCSFGIIPAGFDILVNASISAEHSSQRATVISMGSMIRSVLTLLLAVPAGGTSAENSPVGWAIPALALLVAAVGAYVALRADEQRRHGRAASRVDSAVAASDG
jgi:MFS family permease